jgi:hypothetical protein
VKLVHTDSIAAAAVVVGETMSQTMVADIGAEPESALPSSLGRLCRLKTDIATNLHSRWRHFDCRQHCQHKMEDRSS